MASVSLEPALHLDLPTSLYLCGSVDTSPTPPVLEVHRPCLSPEDIGQYPSDSAPMLWAFWALKAKVGGKAQ